MLHLRDICQDITGHFESQQKDSFYQSNLHEDKSFKLKSDEHEGCKAHLEDSKESKITLI